MGPINYQVDVQSPFTAALQGYQAGSAIRQDQVQQQQVAQQQAALAAQQKLLSGLASKPNATADDYASVMTQIPSLAEPLTKAWAAKNTAQQQSHASDLLQWGAAIKSGKPEIAADQMTQRAELMEQASGSPTRESQALRAQAQVIKEHPQFALGQIQALLAVNPNGKDAATALATFGSEQRAADQAPADLAQKEALAAKTGFEAKSAATVAKFAESKAVTDLKLSEAHIKALAEDTEIKRQNSRIASMNAALASKKDAREERELQMKIADATAKRDTTVRERVAEANTAAATIDNMLNTVDRLKQNPGMREVVGSLEGSDYYPTQVAATVNLLNPFTSTGDDRADAIAMINTLGSQAFLAMVPSLKGTGNLSDAEGKKLETGLQSLSRSQSEKQFSANLDEVQRLMIKARKNIELRTGVKLGIPDTPAVEPSAGDIDALVKKYTAPGRGQ